MKPSSWDKQLGLAPLQESAASQSNQTNNPSMDEDEAGDKVGLDASHHTRISPRGGGKIFFFTSSFPLPHPACPPPPQLPRSVNQARLAILNRPAETSGPRA